MRSAVLAAFAGLVFAIPELASGDAPSPDGMHAADGSLLVQSQPAPVVVPVTAPHTASAKACPLRASPEFPSVGRLKATGVGCRVARGVAREFQRYWKHHQALPARVHRRYTFSCRYRQVQGEFNPYMKAKCVRVNHPEQRVTADLGS